MGRFPAGRNHFQVGKQTPYKGATDPQLCSGSERNRTVSTSRNRKGIEKRVQRNPRVPTRPIAPDREISDRSVKREKVLIAKTELGLKALQVAKISAFH
ncbi:hypothetical protein TNCV_2888041 [Trichonephila clavipes]|nr:hypothetical protein TNCV_2888041 [Trichonephila clavipes]